MMTAHDEISKAFNQSATAYERVAKVQQEIGKRMLARLSYFKIAPQRILDLGCGTGFFFPELRRLFPKAQIIGLDLAQGMLLQAKEKTTSQCALVAADMKALPFANESFDLIFANQVIHWAESLADIISELNRVMKVNACLLFSTLGPDTFIELNSSWSGINPYAHINEFIDMHEIGDCLLAEHFLDPVMDRELLEVHYTNLAQLLGTIKAQGVRNIHPERNPGLTGKGSWQQFEKNYALQRTEAGKYPLTYEVIYGHAWKAEASQVTRGDETFIPLSSLFKTRR